MILLESEVFIKQELVVISIISKLFELSLILLRHCEFVVHRRNDRALTEELFVNITHISLILNFWLENGVDVFVQ